MFKIHSYYSTNKYFLIPPTGYLANHSAHGFEMQLMNMQPVEYYRYIKQTYKSAELQVYPTFLSYTLNKSDAEKHMKKLNKLFKNVK
jgi:hypothetical protein